MLDGCTLKCAFCNKVYVFGNNDGLNRCVVYAVECALADTVDTVGNSEYAVNGKRGNYLLGSKKERGKRGVCVTENVIHGRVNFAACLNLESFKIGESRKEVHVLKGGDKCGKLERLDVSVARLTECGGANRYVNASSTLELNLFKSDAACEGVLGNGGNVL